MLNDQKTKNILIVGSGKAGTLLASDINTNHPELTIVGFIDDIKRKRGKAYLGTISDISAISRRYKLDEIIIAIPSADGKLIRRILLNNISNRIPITIVPRAQDIVTSNVLQYSQVKSLEAEDFLGRPLVRKNVDDLRRFYAGKTVFVTGGAGSIGSEIVRQLIDLKVKKVVVYDNSEYLIFLLEQQLKEKGVLACCELIIGNITNSHKIRMLFDRITPDIVFHAAAYKHVHLMQENIDEAISNNVIGTKIVIDAAIANGVKLFTFISTDKVVNPTSVMGATKKLCEYYIQSLYSKKTQFNIVRFGNVINSNGSALPLFERQIELHGYVTVTHKNMERFFMSIREAAQLVIESTAQGQPNTIHILNMGELINIHEIALCVIRSKNLMAHTDVQIHITGLRKGEKMIEELYTEDEKKNLKHTKMKSIFSLKNAEECLLDIQRVLLDFEKMTEYSASSKQVKTYLKKLFPSLAG